MLPCLSLSLLPDTVKRAALPCHLLCQPQRQQSYRTSDWSRSNLEPRINTTSLIVYVKNSIQAAKVGLAHTGSPFWRCWENRGHIDDWNNRIWDLNTLLSFNMVHFPTTTLDPKTYWIDYWLKNRNITNDSDLQIPVCLKMKRRKWRTPGDLFWPRLLLEHTCKKYHLQHRSNTTELGHFYTIFPRISCNWSQQKSQDFPVICRNC